jgi:FkbM family methyltransferase
MKYFIDLGAYTGDTIKEFFNWAGLVGKPTDYEIFAFEPNPDLHDQMIRITRDYPNVVFKPWAAWTFDGKLEFAKDETATPMGSTVMHSKKAIWDVYPHVEVKCFDFSKWLKQMFNENDEVIVKMDIEGAEFPVLEKMLKDGTITIPRLLFVEWHPNKVQDYTTDYRNALMDKIIAKGGNLKLWH